MTPRRPATAALRAALPAAVPAAVSAAVLMLAACSGTSAGNPTATAPAASSTTSASPAASSPATSSSAASSSAASSSAASSTTEATTTPLSTTSAASGSSSPGAAVSAPATPEGMVTATTDDLDVDVTAPADLAQRLRRGGHVVVVRYTGATVPDDAEPAPQGFVDDGQRVSQDSVEKMKALGDRFRALGIPIGDKLSSEYYFVYQHATAALGEGVQVQRDLTGSLNFDDDAELQRSLQGLRNRTVTPPRQGTTTVLFTHQGKFDKAYGYYLPAGQVLVFEPDGSGSPRLIANLSYDQALALR